MQWTEDMTEVDRALMCISSTELACRIGKRKFNPFEIANSVSRRASGGSQASGFESQLLFPIVTDEQGQFLSCRYVGQGTGPKYHIHCAVTTYMYVTLRNKLASK